MKKRFSLLSFALPAVLILVSGWGFLVHRTIAQLAIYELPGPMQAFFYTHKDSLVYGAPRPDVRRTGHPEEGSKHYMDMEYFGDSAFRVIPRNWDAAVARYTADSLHKYGTLPFVVIEYLGRLTDAFRSGNADSIVFYAADLSHYIGDAHVPLHASMNYDGQLTGQQGLHDLWETTVPEVEMMHYQLSSRHKARYLKSPETRIWGILEHTFSLVPEVFEKEREVARNFNDSTKYRWEVRWGKKRRFYTPEFARQYSRALGRSVNDQLIAASGAIADFWYTAWVNAGKPDLNKLLEVPYQKKAFRNEQKAFRKNELVEKRLLISTLKITKD
ncbi:hypothetical protein GCM10027051_00320 [Niabella terrae]